MSDDVVTYDDTSILQYISELLDQMYEYYTTDLQNRSLHYDVLSTKLDDLNTNIIQLDDDIKSLSSFCVGVFSIIFVFVLAYVLFNNLFK